MSANVDTMTERIVREIRTMSWLDRPAAPSYLELPHDAEAERCVLEALLMRRRRPDELACSAADFFVPIHQGIGAAVEAIVERGLRPRRKLVMGVLERGGACARRTDAYLTELTHEVPANFHVDEFAERIHELANQRRAIELMQRVDTLWRAGERPNDYLMMQLLDALERTRR